jgi:putative chitobiose transport system permease protein
VSRKVRMQQEFVVLPEKREREESGKRYWTITRKRYLAAWLFMLPALVLLAVFTFYPLVYGVILAFFENNLIREPRFVGVDNFVKAFQDGDFWLAMLHSALYLLIVPLIQVAAISMALLVNQKLKGVVFFRSLFYLPVITSLVVAAVVWKWMYAPDYGLINSGIRWFSETVQQVSIRRFKGPGWLTDPALALGSIAFVTFWKGIGYYMVIYLAGLQAVPKELEEAGKLDGAKGWSMARYIIIPLLMPTVALCTIMSTIAALRVFDEVLVMSGGAQGNPNKSTLVASTYIYGRAFGSIRGQFEFGYAAALSLILAAFIWVFTLINLKFFSKGGLEYYS